jgi:hypothetical protein
MIRTAAAIALTMLAVASGVAEDEQAAYLDDRSTPEQIVRSFYNAISHFQHARAYSYFGESRARI